MAAFRCTGSGSEHLTPAARRQPASAVQRRLVLKITPALHHHLPSTAFQRGFRPRDPPVAVPTTLLPFGPPLSGLPVTVLAEDERSPVLREPLELAVADHLVQPVDAGGAYLDQHVTVADSGSGTSAAQSPSLPYRSMTNVRG